MADLINTTGMDLLNPTKFPWSMSASYSGLPEGVIGQLTDIVTPELGKSVQGLSGLPEQFSANALGKFKNMMKFGLEDALKGTMQSMAGRGIIGGDVLSDALSGTARGFIPQFAQQAYQSEMDAANMAQNIPGILGQLLQLAQKNLSTSYSEDKSVPYGQLADFLSNLNLSFV